MPQVDLIFNIILIKITIASSMQIENNSQNHMKLQKTSLVNFKERRTKLGIPYFLDFKIHY
jgi:hypothetical protein